MKRILFITLMLALMGIFAGCCSDPAGIDKNKSFGYCVDDMHNWFCGNRATIQGYIAKAQATITAIQTEFGSMIPVQYQAIIVAAQLVIAEGQNILSSVSCPTDVQVATVASTTNNLSATKAKVNAQRMGMKKALIP